MATDDALPEAEPPAVLRLRAVLDAARAGYRIRRHAPTVGSARDGVEHGLGTLAQMAPTLILRSEQGCFAAIISGSTRLSYRKIRKRLGLRDVSLAPPDAVRAATGAEPGYVPMINPGLRTLVDERVLAESEVFGGCGAPGYALVIGGADLVRAAAADVFDFTEPRT